MSAASNPTFVGRVRSFYDTLLETMSAQEISDNIVAEREHNQEQLTAQIALVEAERETLAVLKAEANSAVAMYEKQDDVTKSAVAAYNRQMKIIEDAEKQLSALVLTQATIEQHAARVQSEAKEPKKAKVERGPLPMTTPAGILASVVVVKSTAHVSRYVTYQLLKSNRDGFVRHANATEFMPMVRDLDGAVVVTVGATTTVYVEGKKKRDYDDKVANTIMRLNGKNELSDAHVYPVFKGEDGRTRFIMVEGCINRKIFPAWVAMGRPMVDLLTEDQDREVVALWPGLKLGFFDDYSTSGEEQFKQKHVDAVQPPPQ